jgi:sigma-E factor negative regulatory protein RseA
MTADRVPDPASRSNRGEWLSSLADGEADAGDVERACRQWRADDELRREWHAYHLIGDVLRSDELSKAPDSHAIFLQSLRARLANEPVPLAPVPLTAEPRPRRWLAPVAVVAGFAVVGVSVLVLRPGSTGPTGWNEPIAVVQPGNSDTVRRVGHASAPLSSQTLVIDGQVIRDARLDAYFEAHRGAIGPMPSAVPGGALRSVEILVPQR